MVIVDTAWYHSAQWYILTCSRPDCSPASPRPHLPPPLSPACRGRGWWTPRWGRCRRPSTTLSCESGYWKFEKWKVKWKSGPFISRSEISQEFSRNSWESRNQEHFQPLVQMLLIYQTKEYNNELFLNQYVTGDFGGGPWFWHVRNGVKTIIAVSGLVWEVVWRSVLKDLDVCYLYELLLVSLWNWAVVKSNKLGSHEARLGGYICWNSPLCVLTLLGKPHRT